MLNVVYYPTERNQQVSKHLTLFLKRNSQHRIEYPNYVSQAEALDRRPLGIHQRVHLELFGRTKLCFVAIVMRQ